MGDRYDKVRRVPFGEYVPVPRADREAGRRQLRACPSRDAIPGTGPAVLHTRVGTMGVVISWEVFFADRARDAISHGGEVLLNPTNGSSYWLDILQSQQVASSRLRAIETGRWTLQAAPTGFSAIVTPDGEVTQRTGISQARVLTQTIERAPGPDLGHRRRARGRCWWRSCWPWPPPGPGAPIAAPAAASADPLRPRSSPSTA